MADEEAPAAPPAAAADPVQLLRDRRYVVILLFGAVIGAPIAFVAYWFLKVVNVGEHWVFATLPADLGFDSPPAWWPLPILVIAGLIVAAAIQYLPGTGGESPVQGFKNVGAPKPIELPGIVIAALATLILGAALGPEAPLIAIGGGLGVLAVHLAKKDAPAQATLVIGAAGSFAAISTLLGSPIVGAFLLMEAAGLGGPLLGIMLVPGLLAAGIGTLVFIGLDNWTGYGTFTLAVPNLPAFTSVTVAEFGWAILIGLLCALLGSGIKRAAGLLEPIVARRRLWLTPALGALIALTAILFQHVTGHGVQQVLFSGETTLAPLIDSAATWSVGSLVLLLVCKTVAYWLSLSSFRGGPTFPALFIGATGGMALSHFTSLPLVAGVAMGIGGMSVAILGLPLTSVLIAAVVLQADAITLTPLIIVSVVVSYVATARLAPHPGAAAPEAAPPASTGEPPPATT
jgi:H+/Cl- antiporter ClcA